ncbi:phasin family protein [Indioceanicola profundi]|uniref:phasin family protein n=1 Tax=Indioceanicola profundi TaxID=2220096 RepID=UPI000E6AD0E0|nr:phasin family protein [Indioceanicola profundi]
MAKDYRNPFMDFDVTKFMDPTKFMDMSRMMADFKVPGVDMEGILATQRKNIEALTTANQLAVEGLQAVMRRQAEIMRQTMEEASSTMSDMMAAGTPEDKVNKQAELIKAQFEKAIANMKELAEMVAKANNEAAEVLSSRVSASIEEMKTTISKSMPKR